MASKDLLPPHEISVSQLALRRGEYLVFEGVDFALSPGHLLLLRGANGSGKSSLLLALAGILRPSAGTITISGAENPLTNLHLVGHQPALKMQLTARENLAFWVAVNGGDQALIAPGLEKLGILQLSSLPVGYFSAGQLQRLALARLLVAERPLWLLDEPLAALDTAGGTLVSQLLAAHLARGGIAIAATHQPIVLPPPAAVTTLTLGGQS